VRSPQVVAVAAGSPADLAGVRVGDEVVAVNGAVQNDVIGYWIATNDADPALAIRRGGLEFEIVCEKRPGEPLGVEVSSAVFDRIRTCDNHCAFCFIYQLPKGMRKSLYVKDDDYRLSFLYGNFTTLTRFTELDFERVVTERLSPLYVSIHATDPEVRARLLRNRRGATSLRWLQALLAAGIEVHGQVVVCPGVNDGAVFDDTLAGVLERFAELATVGVVPLGVSRYSDEEEMRPHTTDEAVAVVDLVERWQERFAALLGRRLVFCADEYYLLADRPFPDPDAYEGFPQLENGVGMAASFRRDFAARRRRSSGRRGGFFASVDGAPALGYRAERTVDRRAAHGVTKKRAAPVVVVTGRLGERVLRPVLDEFGYRDVETAVVDNAFFGGNIGVTGLITFADLDLRLRSVPAEARVLLPDVCLSGGRFLDGETPEALCREVDIVPSDGASLRGALDQATSPLRLGTAAAAR
jgi:putative radical SAM enzyme (TIGR03279 family)